MNGMFQYIGMVPGVNPFTIGGNPYTNSGSVSPVKIASITDGLSNTIAFSEHVHALPSNTTDFYWHNRWFSGDYGDTLFTSFYPINPQSKVGLVSTVINNYSQSMTSCCRPRATILAAPTSRSRMARSISSRKRSSRGN